MTFFWFFLPLKIHVTTVCLGIDGLAFALLMQCRCVLAAPVPLFNHRFSGDLFFRQIALKALNDRLNSPAELSVQASPAAWPSLVDDAEDVESASELAGVVAVSEKVPLDQCRN